MKRKYLKNATLLRRFFADFASQPKERRSSLIFRGHRREHWPLETTLDRWQPFTDDVLRSQSFDMLIHEFRREAFRVVPDATTLPDGIPFELLARHHGIPSPYLDWTESPYVAAFFALEEEGLTSGVSDVDVAIWAFNRLKYQPSGNEIEIINDFELIRYNRRALHQRGQFMRVRTIRHNVIDLLGNALTQFIIPISIRGEILAELDLMGVNAATLFSDLDGAARTARSRLSL